MKHLDLFSGIGGFALAARWAGIETVAFCEIEDFPKRVLQKNFPGIKIHGDIKELDGAEYEGIDLITGGYPCQPFSEAGKRKGTEDDRHLWPEMFRIIKQARPTWMLAENVTGHISMGIDSVLHDLEGEGYTTRTIILPACAVDSPHRRNRVWILANTKSKRFNSGDDCQNKWKANRTQHAPTNKSGSVSWMETGRWPHEPAIHRVAHGVSNRVDRIKGLGNAIVPQVAYEIMRCIQLAI